MKERPAAKLVEEARAHLPVRRVSVWNLANLLTAIRIAMVPVFLWLLLQDNRRLEASAVFMAAMLTDRFDGEIARRRRIITDVGKIADPVADKALTGAAFVGLSLLGELSWWVTAVVLGRELLITVMRLAVMRFVVLPAGKGGKLKTATQAVALTLYLLPLQLPWPTIALAIMVLAVALTVVTGIIYVWQIVSLLLARRSGLGIGYLFRPHRWWRPRKSTAMEEENHDV